MNLRGENVEEKKGFTESEKQEKLKEIEEKKEKILRENSLDEFEGKNKIWKIVTYFFLALAFVLMVSYSVQTFLQKESLVTQLTNMIGTFILAIFSFFFLFTGFFTNSKKGRIFVLIASFLLSCYGGFHLLVGADIIHLKEEVVVIDFTGKDIKEVVDWAQENGIFIRQVYQNSDYIEAYKVISQDVRVGTPIKKLQKITVTVSEGPNLEKETTIPNMIGWNIDEVIQYVDENHLTNVQIEFDFHEEVKRDIVYSQNIESTIKRNEPLSLKVSWGKEDEFQYVTMVHLIGMDEFHATTWLKRNRISYEIEYGYSDSYDEGIVIQQEDKKGKVLDVTKDAKTTITLARNHQISVPKLNEMDIHAINRWAVDNKIKVVFKETYDEKIAKDKVIESSRLKGDTVEVGETIYITISKGQLRMIKFTTIENFVTWADENGLTYDIDYQFNANVKAGQLISSSHSENQLIKNADTVTLVISQGGTTTVPDFSGMTKTQIEDSCKKANLICEYRYEQNNEVEKNTMIKQSMRAGSEVLENATVTITLSSGSN